MRLALQSGVLEPSLAVANENSLINLLNSQIGLFSPITGVAGNTSDTTTDVIDTITIPANLLATGGDVLQIRGMGLFGANAHVKTVGFLLVQGATTVTATGTTASSGGGFITSLDLILTGTPALTFFASLNLAGTGVLSVGTTAISPASPIAVQLVGGTNTATASDVSYNAAYGNLIK